MIRDILEFAFSMALFINALLFIPQAVRIFKQKDGSDISLVTFVGFLIIQLLIVIHGVLFKDWLLVSGYIFSMITCGTVVILALVYRSGRK